MKYYDYNFEINEEGLKLTDKGSPDKWEQVDIKRTALQQGDTFVLELDEDNCMFFKRLPPYQKELIERNPYTE